jgi:hypothetical protein
MPGFREAVMRPRVSVPDEFLGDVMTRGRATFRAEISHYQDWGSTT